MKPQFGHEAYRPDIDGLRAIAVLVVMVFHAWPALLPGGYLGVDVFFVISGFLIAGIIVRELRGGRFSFRRFYARRARRILPALMIVILAGLGIGSYALLAEEFEALGRHSVGATFFIANFLLMAETGYFDVAAETKPLLHLWSLGIEEQFYLTFPLLLWAAWRRKVSLLKLIAGIGGVSLLLHLWVGRTDPTAAFYLPVTRAWELMAGALLAAAAGSSAESRGAGTRRVNLYSVVGGVLVAAAVLLVGLVSAPPLTWLVLAVAGSALLVAAGPDALVNRRLLSLAPLVAIGLISYPLYLWHWLLLSFSRIYFGDDRAAGQLPVALALSFALAWITYRFVERPVRTGALSGGAVAGLLATLASLVVVTGSVVWAREGLPERRAPRLRALAEFAKSPHEPFRDGTCGELLRGFDELDPDGCRSSSSAAPAVVLLGDSHANQYYKSLAQQLPDRAVLHLGRWSCLPFSSSQSEQCQQSIALSRDYVIGQRSVSTVVLAGYWAYLMAGRFTDQPGGYREAAPLDPAGAGVFLRTGHELIAALLAAGKRVVLLLDVPNLNFNVRRCVFDPAAPDGRPRDPSRCTLDRRAFEARNAPYDLVMARLVAGLPGLKVFDPRSVLCDNSVCDVLRDGRSLYFDADHLSRRGADLVIERLIASGLLKTPEAELR